MPIPRINNGDTLKDVRELSLNPVINTVNEHEVELGEKSILIAQNTASTVVNKDAITALQVMNKDVVDVGKKCSVDHRIFNFSTTGQFAGIAVDLEDTEFPVRGATRNFDATAKKGEFIPVENLSYDRVTKTLTASSNGVRNGQLFIEFWRVTN